MPYKRSLNCDSLDNWAEAIGYIKKKIYLKQGEMNVLREENIEHIIINVKKDSELNI